MEEMGSGGQQINTSLGYLRGFRPAWATQEKEETVWKVLAALVKIWFPAPTPGAQKHL